MDPQKAPPPAPGSPAPGGNEPATTRPGARPDKGSPASPSGETRPRGNMLPGRRGRRFGLERLVVRVVATCGIVGIGVALGAILVASKVQGWITGLVIAVVTVVLSALLWSSKQL